MLLLLLRVLKIAGVVLTSLLLSIVIACVAGIVIAALIGLYSSNHGNPDAYANAKFFIMIFAFIAAHLIGAGLICLLATLAIHLAQRRILKRTQNLHAFPVVQNGKVPSTQQNDNNPASRV